MKNLNPRLSCLRYRKPALLRTRRKSCNMKLFQKNNLEVHEPRIESPLPMASYSRRDDKMSFI